MSAQSIDSGKQRGKYSKKISEVPRHPGGGCVAVLSVPAARSGSRACLPHLEHHTLTAGGMKTAQIRSIKQALLRAGQVSVLLPSTKPL